MTQNDSLKETLINALETGNYEVEIEEPNNVILREKYDGSSYLYMIGDDVKFGVDCGRCSVTILGHTFTCEFNYGEWSADDSDDDWLIEDYEFKEALEDAEGVVSGEYSDLDGQAEIYCLANKFKNTLPAYWCEDDDIPKDLDDLDWYDPIPGTVAVTLKGRVKQDVECELYCSSIYELYCCLRDSRELYRHSIVSSNYIKDAVPKLHQEILEELQAKQVIADASDLIRYSLKNRKAFFESILG